MSLMIFEKLIDRKDRKKIKNRTQKNVDGYDYRLSLDIPSSGKTSFLVVGDSGAGGKNKQMKFHVTKEMHQEDTNSPVDFLLHVGDLVYLNGAKEGYPKRFIKPYRYWLKNQKNYDYQKMIFSKPFLPIYGNHDYYDFLRLAPIIKTLVGKLTASIGSGSKNGKVFEEAFVKKDDKRITNGLLPYTPGQHTRIPNRYYWFTHGHCAFFALDANTLDQVERPSDEKRKLLKKELKALEKEIQADKKKLDRFERLKEKNVLTPKLKDQFEDLLDEVLDQEKKYMLLKKRKKANRKDYDSAQLSWLDRVLQHQDAKGKWKIVYMHHSMYSSESGHTADGATGGLRENLRKLFIKHKVNLVLSGHSHCFEWPMRALPKEDESEAEKKLAIQERNICFLVSGGGGKGLRESILEEDSADKNVRKKQDYFLRVAESKAYTSTFKKNQLPEKYRSVYNFLRIDASKNKLRIVPNGVAEEHNNSVRLNPIAAKVFTETETGIKMKIKRLAAINVFRDKEPQGEWL